MSRGSSSYFTYARIWVPRHVARLVVDYFASRGSCRGLLSILSPRAGSSSTTSPMPRVRVPRHVARLVTRLVIDYLSHDNTGSTSSTPCTVATSSSSRITSTIHLD
jgi:hypothetical protein